ncbi:nucleotide sugar dehydrogenase, partial [Prochlorococcus sp. AH-736-N03]|nr:nucleotide sugar dehydrogenase [Prochlorococcus sp. AH-736-N03]
GEYQNLPVFEPGLAQIVKDVRGKNLFFSIDVQNSIKIADLIFISVNTPIKSHGIGAGEASDLKWVESSAREISMYAEGHTIVVEKSTLPVKTARIIKSILESSNQNLGGDLGKTFSVLSNPEFLAEGTAVNDLENPDRVLIGGEDKTSIDLLKEIYLRWVKSDKIITTNLWSSELSKLIANAFLAQRISSINTVSAICESTGANVEEVALAVGKDSRIGEKFLKSGPGFGGSCFKKDILNLVYICKSLGLKEVAAYWNEIIKINDWQQDRIYRTLVEKLYGNISGKRIVILGFSFKANTNDTRNSPAITICRKLLAEDAQLVIHDPKVGEKDVFDALVGSENIINFEKRLIYEINIPKATENADAVLIMTEWEDYINLDWKKLQIKMRKPSWIFDTRSIISPEQLKRIDLNFWQLGNGESY